MWRHVGQVSLNSLLLNSLLRDDHRPSFYHPPFPPQVVPGCLLSSISGCVCPVRATVKRKWKQKWKWKRKWKRVVKITSYYSSAIENGGNLWLVWAIGHNVKMQTINFLILLTMFKCIWNQQHSLFSALTSYTDAELSFFVEHSFFSIMHMLVFCNFTN